MKPGVLACFSHHPDPACDFCEEVEHLESIAESWRLGLTGFGHEADRLTLDDRIERALGFRVGGDLGAIKAKQSLRELAVMRGFDMATPPYAAFFTLVIVNIAIMVPAGPGYMGTFEAAAVVALAPFHVSDSAAISYILVVHALQYVSVTALGLYFMNASGWSLREIEEAENG